MRELPVAARSDLDSWVDLANRDPAAALHKLETTFRRIEPEIHAFVNETGRFERLRKEVRELRSAHARPGPLFGVPLGIKDIFRVDGLPTTAGSKLPATTFEGDEAESVTLLKRAGAVVLGKTVSTEFAYFAPGPTRNPLDPTRTPGGSSSGSAAAVAAGLCAIALGTQTIGSISRPASYCGVVGYKPSLDRISTAGVVPLSPSLDHVGTFTCCVADAHAVARLLCRDWKEARPTRRPVLGMPDGPYLGRASGAAREQLTDCCARLDSHGYELQRAAIFTDLDAIVSSHYTIVAAEAARTHRDWFARYGDRYHAKTRELIERGRLVDDGELAAARTSLKRQRQELSATMRQQGIDLWISPAATGPAPQGLESTGDPIMSLPWTHAGVPTLSIPCASSGSDLPIGLQVAAEWWHDELLLAWAVELEGALN